MTRLAAGALLALLLLAGCSDDAPAPADGAEADLAGAAGSVGLPLDAASSVAAPQWAIGQWWEWEVLFGDQVSEETFCSIVVAADGSSFTLATEKTSAAKEEAAFDTPMLGAAAKGDLSIQGWGGDLKLLQFPLTDGKTWTASMPNIAWDVLLPAETVELAMAASFDEALKGFRITGTAGGGTILEATYLPATGWFGQLVFYDIDPGQEEIEIGFRAKAAGTNYTGPYFIHQATQVLEFFDGSGFTDDPTNGGQPFANPHPNPSFTLTDSATTVFGYLVAETVAGARAVALLDPNNQQRVFESHDAQLAGHGAVLFLDEPAVPGEWRIATAGAGGFSGAYGEVFEVVEGSFQM